jgi:hypothetical protein
MYVLTSFMVLRPRFAHSRLIRPGPSKRDITRPSDISRRQTLEFAHYNNIITERKKHENSADASSLDREAFLLTF